jgi:hypothetical protein
LEENTRALTPLRPSHLAARLKSGSTDPQAIPMCISFLYIDSPTPRQAEYSMDILATLIENYDVSDIINQSVIVMLLFVIGMQMNVRFRVLKSSFYDY